MEYKKVIGSDKSEKGYSLQRKTRNKTSRWKRRRRQQLLAWTVVTSGFILIAVLVWCVCFKTDRLEEYGIMMK